MSILICFLKACLIGFTIAAPVGPIGILCIRRTLEIGFLGALAVGLGAALADSAYGMIAALGLTVISQTLIENTLYIKLLGGLFLLYLAYREIKTEPKKLEVEGSGHKNFWITIPSVFFLTLTNPMTILSFIGIFATLGNDFGSFAQPVIMVIGVFLGSMMWWIILGILILKIKERLPNVWIQRIRYLSAFILGGFGLFSILGSLDLFAF
ncbi:MAG: hypothetical protein B7Y25_01955 [Alphaproteobacteria bacterium 16-39-46]|nr:MAG: hypothetical protein B7Y25_01955 [Alphaproteobacteria bacterium 16-39-46]OZA43742.1 MAG: hypothetical protein B7X84_02205 [Alphaproteobacteria bacterium 17-39-52]HQS83559.1 LysE family transporter [Alphaproteobacteria bacterium]HQS93342.1 LysE family transporter [Alphaproteobacteria bacterium]